MKTELSFVEWRSGDDPGCFEQRFVVSIYLERKTDLIEDLFYDGMYSLVDNIIAQEDDGALQDVYYDEDVDYSTFSPETDGLWGAFLFVGTRYYDKKLLSADGLAYVLKEVEKFDKISRLCAKELVF